MSGLPTGCLVGCHNDGQTKQKIPEVYYMACFWWPHVRYTIPGTPMRDLLGLSWQQTDHISHGSISHVSLSHAQQTDMEKSILPNQACQIKLAKSNLPNQIWQDQPKSQ